MRGVRKEALGHTPSGSPSSSPSPSASSAAVGLLLMAAPLARRRRSKALALQSSRVGAKNSLRGRFDPGQNASSKAVASGVWNMSMRRR